MASIKPGSAEENDALASLEDRVLRVAKLVNELRAAREAAELQARAAKAQEAASEDLRAENARLKEEMAALREERRQVRIRIEKLLGQMDDLGG